MPRAAVDPSRGNTLYAHLADIRIAWAKTPLTRAERRVLFLRYALDWSQRSIARHEGIAESTVAERLARCVGNLTSRLSNASCDEL
ncbi:MAG: sigma-70 region 4 domain-containing protein [Micromonosporaceae bacterium]|nr:sigma-70 region 4 domain-containing protein [Micromonosporaceae bacterium]